MPAVRPAVAAVIAALVLAPATWALHRLASDERDVHLGESRDDDVMYLPRTSLLHHLALGHDELAADLVYVRTLTWFGAELSGGKDFSWLDRALDTTVALDPGFRGPYLFGGRATMYNGLPITNASVLRSNHFLELGLARFPDDWELAFNLGCNFLNELKTDDARQKEVWRRTGGAYIRRAAVAGGGPVWLPNLAATILTEEGQLEAAVRYLEEAYLTTDSEASRDEIIRLLAAKRHESMGHLSKARDEFHARWQRALPYAPADIYILVGDAPVPRLDLPFLERDPVLDAAE